MRPKAGYLDEEYRLPDVTQRVGIYLLPPEKK